MLGYCYMKSSNPYKQKIFKNELFTNMHIKVFFCKFPSILAN